jgi:hypothetical protein
MSVKNLFEEIKNSDDPNEINEYIIELAEGPKEGYLPILDYLIEDISETLLDNIRVNLVYLIGELALTTTIPRKYLDFLKTQYVRSDRWERNEIIKAFKNIVKHQEIKREYIDVIATAVKEDYLSLKKNALECLIEIQSIGEDNLKKILLSIDTNEREVIKKARKIIRKELSNQERLFKILNKDGFYRFISKYAIRTILMTLFKTVMRVESFRERIAKSDWKNPAKRTFLKEIDTYEKILLKNR